VADVENLVEGFAALAIRIGVSVVGGNIKRNEGSLVVDVTAGGDVGSRRWLPRDGARAGHDIYVSGTVGAAATGLEMLAAGHGPGDGQPGAGCMARHRRPEPRVRLGMAMGRARAARAAMDLSDGLADALRQVAAASDVGLRIDADTLPIDPAARAWWESCGVDPATAVLKGGDDYELLFAVPAKGRAALRSATRHVSDPPLTKIGVFTKDPRELVLTRAGKEEAIPDGYQHFRYP